MTWMQLLSPDVVCPTLAVGVAAGTIVATTVFVTRIVTGC